MPCISPATATSLNIVQCNPNTFNPQWSCCEASNCRNYGQPCGWVSGQIMREGGTAGVKILQTYSPKHSREDYTIWLPGRSTLSSMHPSVSAEYTLRRYLTPHVPATFTPPLNSHPLAYEKK